jgi:hypothetical protein
MIVAIERSCQQQQIGPAQRLVITGLQNTDKHWQFVRTFAAMA